MTGRKWVCAGSHVERGAVLPGKGKKLNSLRAKARSFNLGHACIDPPPQPLPEGSSRRACARRPLAATLSDGSGVRRIFVPWRDANLSPIFHGLPWATLERKTPILKIEGLGSPVPPQPAITDHQDAKSEGPDITFTGDALIFPSREQKLVSDTLVLKFRDWLGTVVWRFNRRSTCSCPIAHMRKANRGGGTRLVVSGLPPHLRPEDFEPLLSQYGQVHSCEKVNSRDPQTATIIVTYDTPDQAQHAISELNNTEYEGSFLKVELQGNQERRGPGGGRAGGRGPRGFAMGGGARQTDFPLRILVQSDMVGAIIGRQGSTIRQITQQSRARVDVHRKDNVGSLEKAITIYGNPENCTNACKRILEVMKQEATTNNKGEITLKVLAHNNLIGRIIGKAGNTIKRIMQETDTKITVSSINDINSFNLERIITVKGSIENMSKAESMISAKLRQSYENDLQAMAVSVVTVTYSEF
ncbi:unnamed protein product [Nezara viridula]|uniref:RRM domain-containing protein n=1 Tax=Nezara viridula TaxID=85310 RepID=A0A9P0EC63_NEZVI|nr:unnamed protein product [Nezara viridula]